ncbi:MAG: hypothetical protein HY898_21860 [Deltaproteobacteria bacterium]|nr:hypothetical protein [Deltaproteobacteria bacterium]
MGTMPYRHSFPFLAAALACASFALACGGPPPKKAQQPDNSADEPPPAPAWLFVTESGQPARGPKGECEKVRGWIAGEKSCTGELCAHARDLGKEWLKRCRKTMPEQADEVSEVIDKASERAELGADDCIRDGNNLLRSNECGKAKECVQATQRWISRCGQRYATPLIVLMLTKRAERRFNEPTSVEFDTRSCKDIGELIHKSIGCASEETCKQPADAVAAWTDRCGEAPASLPLAFAMADVLVGASRGVDPIKTDPELDKLDDGAFTLMTKDAKGTAIWVCGERPTSLQTYVATRAKCSPGEVIFARLDGSHRVKTLSVPHASDAEFQRLFPFLEVKGERDARDKAELGAFQKRVGEAVESAKSGRGAQAAAQLASALIPHAAAVLHNPEYRKVLSDADPFLGPAMREWAKRKIAASARIKDATESALFAGRSLQHPLADMRLDGSVLPGAYIPPAGFALAEWMPSSFAIYRKDASKLEAVLKKKLSDAKLADLRTRIRNEVQTCAAAMAAISKAEESSAACLFRDNDCAPNRAAGLSSAVDQERERAAAAQRNIALMLAGGALDRADIERIESEKVAAGCLD